MASHAYHLNGDVNCNRFWLQLSGLLGFRLEHVSMPAKVVFVMDPKAIPRLMDHLLEHHSIAFLFTLGFFAFIIGYAGLHWINRRRFYRRKLRDPFPTYFTYWRTRLIEGWLGLFFLGCSVAGLLTLFVGIIDTIDG